MSKLYIVGTPIGNLEDITLRAVRTLKEVDVILCEDTRVTGKLLARYEITTKKMSYHARSGDMKIENILELLRDGKDLALVSDAGMPTISDPGAPLVSKIKEELPDTEILSIPGASAVTAALSIAGVPASEFLFLGFLPHKKGRETLFKEIAESKRVVVLYESPHRIMKTLHKLLDIGCPVVVVARELTKIHEQVVSGTPAELIQYFEKHPSKVRGEFVVIIEPF